MKGDAGPRKIEAAANALSARVVENVSAYVQEKVELLEQQVAVSESQLAAIEVRIQAAQRQQDTLIQDQSIPLDQRLLLSANLNSVYHDRGRAPHVAPGRPLRVAPASHPRRER